MTTNRNTYIAYSATPFVNIFINDSTWDETKENDLFPRNFLISLREKGSYFGLKKMFATYNNHSHIQNYPEGEVFIENALDDNNTDEAIKFEHNHSEDQEFFKSDDDSYNYPISHNTETITDDDLILWSAQPSATDLPLDIPPTLKRAIRYFILTIVVKNKRSDKKTHNTMLISSPKVKSIDRGKFLVQRELKDIINSIQTNSKLPVDIALQDPQIKELYALWVNDKNLQWSFKEDIKQDGEKSVWEKEIMNSLSLVANLQVKAINNESKDTLPYGKDDDHGNPIDPINVIAIGGFTFGRGFTLKGLSVSYILRKVQDMDTLLQLARWFGYRSNYVDLVRVWLPDFLQIAFFKTAKTVLELEKEFLRLEQTGGTPEEFGLVVKTHPEIVNVTARRKIGFGERILTNIQFSSRSKKFSNIDTNPETISDNTKAVHNLYKYIRDNNIESMVGKEGHEYALLAGRYGFRHVPYDGVMEFFDAFKTYNGKEQLIPNIDFIQYIRKRIDVTEDELRQWDIVFRGVANKNDHAHNFQYENKIDFTIENLHRCSGWEYYKEENILKQIHGQPFDASDEKIFEGLDLLSPDNQNGQKLGRKNPLLVIGFMKMFKILGPKTNEHLEDEWCRNLDPIPIIQIFFPKSFIIEEKEETLLNIAAVRQMKKDKQMTKDEKYRQGEDL